MLEVEDFQAMSNHVSRLYMLGLLLGIAVCWGAEIPAAMLINFYLSSFFWLTRPRKAVCTVKIEVTAIVLGIFGGIALGTVKSKTQNF